jgi:phosphohistidine phosphatase
MKNLLLLRHGKSDWGATYEQDHDRPLADRGQLSSRLVGRFLASVGPLPERAITSSALRARSTLELAMKAGSWSAPTLVSRDLYQSDPQTILKLIQKQDDSLSNLMLVGHNPTWETLAALMIGGGGLRFPTAAVARIKFTEESWKQIQFGQGTLSWLVTPKILSRLCDPRSHTVIRSAEAIRK